MEGSGWFGEEEICKNGEIRR